MVLSEKDSIGLPDPEVVLSHGQSWGGWHLDAERRVLGFTDGHEIHLERFNSSADMLDEIFEAHRRASSQDVADLLNAFVDIFHPQQRLRSCGDDFRIEKRRSF